MGIHFYGRRSGVGGGVQSAVVFNPLCEVNASHLNIVGGVRRCLFNEWSNFGKKIFEPTKKQQQCFIV